MKKKSVISRLIGIGSRFFNNFGNPQPSLLLGMQPNIRNEYEALAAKISTTQDAASNYTSSASLQLVLSAETFSPSLIPYKSNDGYTYHLSSVHSYTTPYADSRFGAFIERFGFWLGAYKSSLTNSPNTKATFADFIGYARNEVGLQIAYKTSTQATGFTSGKNFSHLYAFGTLQNPSLTEDSLPSGNYMLVLMCCLRTDAGIFVTSVVGEKFTILPTENKYIEIIFGDISPPAVVLGGEFFCLAYLSHSADDTVAPPIEMTLAKRIPITNNTDDSDIEALPVGNTLVFSRSKPDSFFTDQDQLDGLWIQPHPESSVVERHLDRWYYVAKNSKGSSPLSQRTLVWSEKGFVNIANLFTNYWEVPFTKSDKIIALKSVANSSLLIFGSREIFALRGDASFIRSGRLADFKLERLSSDVGLDGEGSYSPPIAILSGNVYFIYQGRLYRTDGFQVELLSGDLHDINFNQVATFHSGDDTFIVLYTNNSLTYPYYLYNITSKQWMNIEFTMPETGSGRTFSGFYNHQGTTYLSTHINGSNRNNVKNYPLQSAYISNPKIRFNAFNPDGNIHLDRRWRTVLVYIQGIRGTGTTPLGFPRLKYSSNPLETFTDPTKYKTSDGRQLRSTSQYIPYLFHIDMLARELSFEIEMIPASASTLAPKIIAPIVIEYNDRRIYVPFTEAV